MRVLTMAAIAACGTFKEFLLPAILAFGVAGILDE
jgi:hypothetical protein